MLQSPEAVVYAEASGKPARRQPAGAHAARPKDAGIGTTTPAGRRDLRPARTSIASALLGGAVESASNGCATRASRFAVGGRERPEAAGHDSAARSLAPGARRCGSVTAARCPPDAQGGPMKHEE